MQNIADGRMKEPPSRNVPATQRELVADYFQSTVPEWEEIYTRKGQHAVYDEIYRLRLAVALSLVDGLELPPGRHCLDVGCGPGMASVALAQRGFHVNAIDIVDAQLDRTRQRAAQANVGERVSLGLGDIYKLAFLSGTFDVVFVVGIMEWLEKPEEGMREVARVLKPGGFAILAVDNKWALRNILDPITSPLIKPIRRGLRVILERLGLHRKSENYLRLFSYSIRQFDRFITNAGMHKQKGVTMGFGPFPFCGLEIPKSLGLPLHQSLQRLADRNFPWLRSAGFVYLAAAQKPLDSGDRPSASYASKSIESSHSSQKC